MRSPLLRLTLSTILFAALSSTLRAQEAAKPEDEAWRKVIEPSRVTVKIEKTPVKEAFRKITELTGNRFVLDDVPNLDAAAPVTMDFKDEPFWKVVGVLEGQVGYRLEAADAMAYRCGGSLALNPAWTVFVGPARVQLAQCSFTRKSAMRSDTGILPEPHPPETPTLAFAVDVEPRFTVAQGSLRLTELLDETGYDMLAANDRHESVSKNWLRWWHQGPGSGGMVVPVGLPAPNATKIRLLKGRLELRLAQYTPPVAVFIKDLDKSRPWAGTTFACKLTQSDRVVRAKVSTGPAKSAEDIRALLVQVGWLGSDDNVRRVHVDRVKPAPGADGSLEAEISFGLPNGVELKALLLPDIAPPRPASWDFEMRDIPLPPLKAIYAKSKAGESKPAPERPIAPAPAGFSPLVELRGSTFTVKADNMPLADLAAEITRQTGNRVDAPGLADKVTGDWKNVEFWPGIAALCRDKQLIFETSADFSKSNYSFKRVAPQGIQERTSRIPDPSRFVGPLYLELREVRLTASCGMSYGLKPAASEGLTLHLDIIGYPEPACLLQRYGASTEECVLSTGVDLATTLDPPYQETKGTPGFAKPEDPRCAGHFSVADWPFLGELAVLLPIRLQATDLAERVARLRLYVAVETFDEPNHIEIADAAKPSTHKLPDGLTIHWLGIEETNGRRELKYRAEREGGLTDRDKDMLALRRVALIGKDGRRLFAAQPGYGPQVRTVDRTITVPITSHLNPVKALISLHPRTYAGIVEFRDIPLPVLPATD